MSVLPITIAALVYILISICGCYFFLKLLFEDRPLLKKWTLLWVSVNCAVFVIPSYWGFIGVIVLINLFILPKSENERIVYYFLLLPAMVSKFSFSFDFIPGINYLFNFNFPRMLGIIFLIPIFSRSFGKKDWKTNKKYLNTPIDVLVVCYFVLNSLLSLREPTFTSTLRQIFLLSIMIPIPYFAISKSVTSLNDFRMIYKAIYVSICFVSCIGLLEVITNWTFYNVIPQYYGDSIIVPNMYNVRSYRYGMLRMASSIGEQIPLGYVIVIGLGVTNFFKNNYKERKLANILVYILMGICIFLTGSRGAILAAFTLFCSQFFYVLKGAFKSLFLIVIFLAVFLFLQFGDVSMDSLDEFGTFEYRIDLFKNALEVVKQNFLFGSNDFMESETMQRSMQGQGIIDVVNTYISVALNSGIIGLSIFVAVFFVLCKKIHVKISRLRINDSSSYRTTGITLISVLIATIVLIGTVSSVGHIPYYYWAFIGLGNAYIQLQSEDEFKEVEAECKT